MNTKITLFILVAISIVFSYFTLEKMKAKTHIPYKVIVFDKYDLCFLIDPTYKIEKNKDVFKYQAGQNLGEFTLQFRAIDSKMKQSYLGDFKGAYKKKVDFRIFEYEIAEGVVLRDDFDFVKKLPPNILPVRKNCSKYLERFEVLFHL